MNVKSVTIAAMAVAGIALAPVAKANIIISVDGVRQVDRGGNGFASVQGSFGNFNISSTGVSGVAAFGGSGELIDVGSMDISTTGAGTLTVDVTETGLTAPGLASFTSAFSGEISNASVTRAFFADPADAGARTVALGSTTSTGGGASTLADFTAPYSLTEVITVTAAGAILSSDDSVRVPEPASVALLGFGLFGIGMVARRRA